MSDVLLIHGAWHGAWCWDAVVRGLEAAGHRPMAIDLPGHDRPGEVSRRWSTIGTYLSAIEAAARQLDDPVLVGHSMGGYLLQRHLERHTAPLAILVASVPSNGALGATLRLMRAEPRAILRSIVTLDYRHAVATQAQVRDLFFTPDTATTTVADTHARMQNESALAIATMQVRPPRARRVRSPIRVVAAAHDAIFPITEQAATADRYGTAPVVLDGGHDLMLDGCRDELIAELARMIDSVA